VFERDKRDSVTPYVREIHPSIYTNAIKSPYFSLTFKNFLSCI